MARSRRSFDSLETEFIGWVDARARQDLRYAEVLDIYRWAKKHHTGVRDNGEPEFIHPLRLALKVTSLIDRMEKKRGGYLPDALDLLKASICHDMLEDKDRDMDTKAVMNRHFLGRRIGVRAAQIVFNVSRKYINDDGMKIRKSKDEDQNAIRSDPAALLLKHLDRNDNLGTMVYFTPGGIPQNVIYTPDKAQEKFLEAIQFLMQASLPERVLQNYGPQWVDPMKMASSGLLRTIENVTTSAVKAFTRRTIYHPTDFGVSKLITFFASARVFPEQKGERLSKLGVLPIGEPVGDVPAVSSLSSNAPGSEPIRKVGGPSGPQFG